MPLYDYRCHVCGHIKEIVAESDNIDPWVCPECGYDMYRIITLGRGNSMPIDCDWLASVREVVNKNPKTQKPEDKEFLKFPSRQNYKNWKKANNLRHLESGEGDTPKKTDMNKFKVEQKDALNKKFAKDNAITL